MKKIWKDNAKLILSIAITLVIASGATFAATTMYESNTVSYDNTASGLRSTNVQSALDELYGNVAQVIINIKDKVDELYEIKDIASGESTAGLHNAIFRGKDVSSYMPSSVVSGGDGSIYDRIAGTNGYSMFQNLYVGDYIVANGITWRIAGFDIYYMTGVSSVLTTHHAVIVPDEILGRSYMNSTRTTSGGYVGSYMYTTTLPSVLTTYITPVFSGHILSHDTVLTNSVNENATNNRYGGLYSGASCGWNWYNDRYLDIMNEIQVTGNPSVSSSYFDTGSDNIQFPLFRLRPEFKIAYNSNTHSTRDWYFLRSVASSVTFVCIYNLGHSSDAYADDSGGVRPYFYIG